MTSTPQWVFSRECANLFVGPLDVTATVDGSPVDPADILFAILPAGQRPTDTDWTAPVANPDGSGIGVIAQPVDAQGRYGWWVKVTVGAAVDVLEPEDVAWLIRT